MKMEMIMKLLYKIAFTITGIVTCLASSSYAMHVTADDGAQPLHQETVFFGKDQIPGYVYVYKLNIPDKNEQCERYGVYLYIESITNIGRCEIRYNRALQSAYCYSLWISPDKRSRGAGSHLAAATAQFLLSLSCNYIGWEIGSFDLKDGENAQEMYPKLFQFYESLGGTYDAQSKIMLVDLKQLTQKEPENKNLNRALVIAQHIAPIVL
jgi:hypothetical protein